MPDLDQPENMDLLRNACKGWSARYEILAIDEKAARECGVTIPLDEAEVMLQLRQSLRLSPIQFWRLKFPMTISSDLRMVCVLRTVQVFHSNESGAGGTFTSSAVTLSTDFTTASRFNWSKERPFFRLPYSYDCTFSFDNRYLVFREFDMAATVNARCFAIFHLVQSSLAYEATIVNRIASEEDVDGVGLYAIHPYESRMIFTGARGVYLWELESCMFLP
jgi:hypothetical protein